MKIALIGYGKMGKSIEQIALKRGHEIILIKKETPRKKELMTIEMAIDFSIPQAAFDNIKVCLENGVRVVSGTTGWLSKYENAVKICKDKKCGFVYASNFSVGVNIFFNLNKRLAKMMDPYKEYQVEMEEIHHEQKQDAPSGTAITLAKGIIQSTDYSDWYLRAKAPKENAIPIQSKRIGIIPGTHTIRYSSYIDSIEIKHTAHCRDGFALGAVIAAEWLYDKTGIFDMQDVLGLKS